MKARRVVGWAVWVVLAPLVVPGWLLIKLLDACLWCFGAAIDIARDWRFR